MDRLETRPQLTLLERIFQNGPFLMKNVILASDSPQFFWQILGVHYRQVLRTGGGVNRFPHHWPIETRPQLTFRTISREFPKQPIFKCLTIAHGFWLILGVHYRLALQAGRDMNPSPNHWPVETRPQLTFSNHLREFSKRTKCLPLILLNLWL